MICSSFVLFAHAGFLPITRFVANLVRAWNHRNSEVIPATYLSEAPHAA
jgi:hypothetical protein